MSTMSTSRSASGSVVTLSPSRPRFRASTTGVSRRPMLEQDRPSPPRAGVRRRSRDGIVEGDDEIALGRGADARLDRLPRRQQVGERDGAEIMPERRAGARRRRLHGGDAGRDDDLEAARADPEGRRSRRGIRTPAPPWRRCRHRRRRRARPSGLLPPAPAPGARAPPPSRASESKRSACAMSGATRSR